MWDLGWHVMQSKLCRLLAYGITVTALGANAVVAQTVATQTADSAPRKTEVPAVTDVTAKTKPPEPEVGSTPAQASPSTKTVLDYEASEQISEDFSVSFPVDI